jgi:hypothetical protein
VEFQRISQSQFFENIESEAPAGYGSLKILNLENRSAYSLIFLFFKQLAGSEGFHPDKVSFLWLIF